MTEQKERLEAIADGILSNNGFSYKCEIVVRNEKFPTRVYDGVTLKSGYYDALIVNLGKAEGDNWWCVVYPPLCTAAAADLPQTAADAGMSDDDLGLITEENPGYVLKFRSLELWEQLRQWLGKR